ncbi:hypothetical protein LINPERHAP1_LOCUS27735 [Linum perenne]
MINATFLHLKRQSIKILHIRKKIRERRPKSPSSS